MRISTLLGTALAASLGLGGLVNFPAQAVQLADGTVYFIQPPSLVDASATQTQTFVWGSIYYFTISLPENAGEPLQKVVIVQRDGSTSAQRISFDSEESQAFVGTRGDRSSELPLGETVYDRETQTVSVTFDPPVPPGTTFTIALHPERNPQIDGVYLFGVTAFPAGEVAHGQFLGYGRLQFYSDDNFSFF